MWYVAGWATEIEIENKVKGNFQRKYFVSSHWLCNIAKQLFWMEKMIKEMMATVY